LEESLCKVYYQIHFEVNAEKLKKKAQKQRTTLQIGHLKEEMILSDQRNLLH
jgi:hypothetical protein